MPTDKQRREAERRRQQRQLQRRHARREHRRRVNLIISIVGALVAIVVIVVFAVTTGNDHSEPTAGSNSPTRSSSPSPTASPSSSATATVAAYPCTWTKSGGAAKPATAPPTTKPARTGTVNVAVSTSQGPMTFTLNRAAAPCAVESFVSLAGQKYFDKTPCHRITTSTSLSVLQCGDPGGTGSGGPGYTFADELTGEERYTRGVIAMANGAPNTNGSQFFIVYRNSTVSPAYTVFGTVTKGLGVVDKVAAKGATTGDDGPPKLPISITRARLAK